MRILGWDRPDIVLVSGDAYVDHPSFGVALIARWLEAHGFRVAILPQPRHWVPDDFRRLGKPRLFFGITAGNMDSIVANYTGNGRVRQSDPFSPEGNPWFGSHRDKKNRRRPDRATIVYANLARQAFGDVPVILGGIEASLRRFVHYDYQQDKLRKSVLSDAKADLLVYGMGERAVLEIATRLRKSQDLHGIPGTCQRLTPKMAREFTDRADVTILPSFNAIRQDTSLFLKAELQIDRHARALSDRLILQDQSGSAVLQNPAAAPLTSNELDRLYQLAFTRRPHPAAGDIPAWRMIRHSITVIRGCFGNCSFCAIARHQGPVITERSKESVVKEALQIVKMQDFHGTITDIGGPTANLYGTSCTNPAPCKRRDCLFPRICRYMKVDEEKYLTLIDEVASIKGVRHLFVSSGLRMDILVKTPRLLRALLLRHTSGMMKIAPEHTHPAVLKLMHKPGKEILEKFLSMARRICKEEGISTGFNPYLISSHPGCTIQHMKALSADLKRLRLKVRQFQDFTPTPGTISTAMYVTGLHRDTGNPIPVARNRRERMAQRRILEALMKKKTEQR